MSKRKADASKQLQEAVPPSTDTQGTSAAALATDVRAIIQQELAQALQHIRCPPATTRESTPPPGELLCISIIRGRVIVGGAHVCTTGHCGLSGAYTAGGLYDQ